MNKTNHLIIFAKAPEVGRVKQRLAREIGGVEAARLYRIWTTRLLRRVGRDARWRCWLAVSPDGYARRGRFWPATLPRRPQGGGDLGRRMARPFRDLPPGPAVLVGTDIPALGSDQISRAFAALGRADAVFGPASDGGYWLVGLRRRRRLPGLFDHVAWSGSHVLEQTLENLPPGLRVDTLETLDDIDDAAALARWRATAHLQEGRTS